MSFSKFNDFNYFDSPDGEDTLKKAWCAARGAGVFGFGIATMDVMLHYQHKGYSHILGRYAFICLPIIGIVTAFAVVTNTATNIRGKDDKLNWALGALAAGGIFGAWRKSNLAGFTACSILTGAALLKKHALQNDWTLIDQTYHQQQGGVRTVNHDFTITKERPRNWVRE